MLVFLLTSAIIDVGQRVKLIGYNIDIVATDTVTLTGDALAFIRTSNGVELTAADLALFRVEVGCNGVYTGWITNEDNLVGQLFWL